MAVPGSIVGVGKLITPGGQQGPKGDAGTAANVPLADITQNGLLRQNTGKTTDFVDGTNNCQPIIPQITSVRLRSYNSLGNPNFEVNQRTPGVATALGTTFLTDRWASFKSGTLAGTSQQIAASPVLVPGTNFAITTQILRLVLSTQQSSLAAGDILQIYQFVEGPLWRELVSDVHSVSLMVRSSVAGLSFGLYLKDPPTTTKSLTKLCVIPTANTWTLIQLPNIPVWPSGNFVTTPGSQGYYLGICLAAGTTSLSPANDTWQNGNFSGAVGQSNWAASSVNSTFDIAFVQHEPGAVCSTLMDKPFSQNLDECQRYFAKSYGLAVASGAVTNVGEAFMYSNSAGLALGYVKFPKTMAKIPTVTIYNSQTGTINSCQEFPSATNRTVTGTSVGDSALSWVVITSMASGQNARFHYTADTGW